MSRVFAVGANLLLSAKYMAAQKHKHWNHFTDTDYVFGNKSEKLKNNLSYKGIQRAHTSTEAQLGFFYLGHLPKMLLKPTSQLYWNHFINFTAVYCNFLNLDF